MKNPYKDTPFCWTIQGAFPFWTQQVKIDVCNPKSPNQLFDYRNGKLVSRRNSNLCVVVQTSELPSKRANIKNLPCFGIHWAVTNQNAVTLKTELRGPVQSDGPITPLCLYNEISSKDLCWQTKTTSSGTDQELWLDRCSSENKNR